MVTASGFNFNEHTFFPTSGSNQAYMLEANGEVLVENALVLKKRQTKKPTNSHKEIQRTTWKTTPLERNTASFQTHTHTQRNLLTVLTNG